MGLFLIGLYLNFPPLLIGLVVQNTPKMSFRNLVKCATSDNSFYNCETSQEVYSAITSKKRQKSPKPI